MTENLKDLSPEERIKKLKKVEAEKKKEIESAQKMLRESEQEITQREEWKRKVPIPQIAVERTEGMSEAEKEILGSHKDLKDKEVESKKPKEKIIQEEESLEESIAKEKINLAPELMQSDYTAKLSQEPMDKLYNEMKDIYNRVEESGYLSSDDQRKVQYISAATEVKMESGEYSLTEKVAMAANLTKKIGTGLMYHRGDGKAEYQS